MVLAGKVNKEIVSRLSAVGVRAVGISGVDGTTLLAERKKKIVVVDEHGRKRAIEGGYTGRIVKVDGSLIEALLSQRYIVVVAPVAAGTEGEMLNVDADQAAFRIAGSLGAERLVILTDVEGLLIDGALVKRLSVSEAEALLPKVGTGMNRKLIYALQLRGTPVREVIISSGLKEKPLSRALGGDGTVIVNSEVRGRDAG
jgi:acetylglutamate/LysW-gamma-L-alpha-aminoadipate kinase